MACWRWEMAAVQYRTNRSLTTLAVRTQDETLAATACAAVILDVGGSRLASVPTTLSLLQPAVLSRRLALAVISAAAVAAAHR